MSAHEKKLYLEPKSFYFLFQTVADKFATVPASKKSQILTDFEKVFLKS